MYQSPQNNAPYGYSPSHDGSAPQMTPGAQGYGGFSPGGGAPAPMMSPAGSFYPSPNQPMHFGGHHGGHPSGFGGRKRKFQQNGDFNNGNGGAHGGNGGNGGLTAEVRALTHALTWEQQKRAHEESLKAEAERQAKAKAEREAELKAFGDTLMGSVSTLTAAMAKNHSTALTTIADRLGQAAAPVVAAPPQVVAPPPQQQHHQRGAGIGNANANGNPVAEAELQRILAGIGGGGGVGGGGGGGGAGGGAGPAAADIPEPSAQELLDFVNGQLTQDQARKIRMDLDLDDVFDEAQMIAMPVLTFVTMADVPDTGSRQEWTVTYREFVERRSKAVWTRRDIILRCAYVSTKSQ